MADFHGFSVSYRFPVAFTENAFAPENPALVDALSHLEPGRRHRLVVAIDSQVATAFPGLPDEIAAYCAAHADALQLVGTPLVVTGGEAVKNDLTHTMLVLRYLHDAGIDRQSFVIVIGGGAVLDMVSFAAALTHRSVRIVRVPTTVLAQGDSGIAVKNGVNLFGKKNFIGTFVPPFAVINDSRFLHSLSDRDVLCGVVEAVKVSLLRDPEFFAQIEAVAPRIQAGDRTALPAVVRRSAELHLAHICGNGDPFELGSARPLDFGHWAAHKIEAMTSHRLRHGEAVAIGMALDIRYAVRKGYLDAFSADRIMRLLEALGLSLWDETLLVHEPGGDDLALLAGLREFQEHLGGELHVTMLRGIGRSFEVHEMDEACVRLAIDDLATRAHQRHPAAALGR